MSDDIIATGLTVTSEEMQDSYFTIIVDGTIYHVESAFFGSDGEAVIRLRRIET
jgi:hypothetical protein